MSPIYVRPVREQLEHDRLIRQLQTKYQKKFEVLMNVGEERVAPVKLGMKEFFPDLVLYEGKKLAGLVEVESAESTNNLEAMAQWVHFSRARVPFHLYVPVQAYDSAKRLADANSAKVTEIWTYRAAMEGFDLVRMHWETPHASRSGQKQPPPAKPASAVAPKVAAPKAAAPVARPKPVPAKAKPAPAKPAAKNGKAGKAAKSARPAKPVKKAAAKPVSKAAKKPDKSRKAGSARKR